MKQRLLTVLTLCFISAASLGDSCSDSEPVDSCSDSNSQCVGGTCQCNGGYYDSDGISDNSAGTCTLRK